ncbi:MAG: phytoene desaturase family protein [Nitrososphaerales archaeon]
MASADFIVVGGGTNGLSAAAYLAKEGYSTLVLERSDNLGGGALTQDNFTLQGFKHDIFATSINIWRASSIEEDLDLRRFGYSDVNPDPVASTPFRNKKAISIYRDLNQTLKSFSQFSEKDASKFKEVYQFYLDSKDIILGSLASSPVPFSSMMSALEGSDTGLDFLQFSYMSSRDWLEENFESEEAKAFLALWGSNHVPLSPEDAGSAILILVFIGLLQEKGAGVPIGGMVTLVGALKKCVEFNGGKILTGENVSEILVNKGGSVEGVRTSSGKQFEARKGVVASVEPKSLFLNLVRESALEEKFRSKVKNFRYSKVTQVMVHAAMSDWLDYDPSEVRMAGLVQIGDSLNQISRAFNDCVVGRMPDEPFMTIDNTTCYDTSRAPKGKHIMWNFVRAPVFLNGKPWSEEDKEKFAIRCIDRLADYAPNTNKIIMKKVILSPQDIEKINPNIVYGDPGGGKSTLDQSLGLRPFPYWSEYRTPVKGLYMCSPSNHPGGGISGLSGHNAALAAIEDARKAPSA